MTLIKKGAEANLFLEDFSEVLYPDEVERVLVKRRIAKDYRAEKLDKKLRDYRTSLESRILSDAKKAGVPTPTVYRIDRRNTQIVMEYIEGEAVKEFLESLVPESRKELCQTIGEQIARLHEYGIIHGDLTTSNMIRNGKGIIYFIDFGLGEYNPSVEAQGTDIHLLHRTLKSTHFSVAEESFGAILKGYRKILGEDAKKVIRRVKEIERRGRYIGKEERSE